MSPWLEAEPGKPPPKYAHDLIWKRKMINPLIHILLNYFFYSINLLNFKIRWFKRVWSVGAFLSQPRHIGGVSSSPSPWYLCMHDQCTNLLWQRWQKRSKDTVTNLDSQPIGQVPHTDHLTFTHLITAEHCFSHTLTTGFPQSHKSETLVHWSSITFSRGPKA